MAKNKEKDILKDTLLSIGADYAVGRDGTLYYIERKQLEDGTLDISKHPIANHTPLLVERRILDNGLETVEELVFNVLRNFQKQGETAVTTKDILSLTPNMKYGADCIIYIGNRFKARYSEALQLQCEKVKPKIVYQHTGYTIVDGERVFINGDNSVTKDGLTDAYNVSFVGELSNYRFVREREPERFDTLLNKLPNVAPDALIYAMLGLVFLTPLNALLRDEGIEPSFILYYIGKTGVRKTSLAKLALNFVGTFDNGTSPPANFFDTANAIEKKLALTDSVVMLIDDRVPSTTPDIKRKMESIEQTISRQIGNRQGRGRLNADTSNRKAYIAKSNVIVTAEDAYSNIGESAIARSIAVEIKPDDINLDMLTDVQRNAGHLNQCMSEYIQWLLINWDDIKSRVKPMFLDLRSKAQSGGHGRLAETVAHLFIGVMFMCEWLQSIGQMDANRTNTILPQTWELFKSLAEDQNRRITDEKPVKLFLDAIIEMQDRNALVIKDIAESGDSFLGTETRDKNHAGYKDDDFYYLFDGEIYSVVTAFYAAQGRTFPLSKSALWKQLADDGLIVSDKDHFTKTKKIKGKVIRFLWLRATAIDTERSIDNG